MRKSYYLFNPGRMSRKDNTLKFTPVDEDGHEGQTKFIPVEAVSDLYVFGSLDANSALYTFLGNHRSTFTFLITTKTMLGPSMPKITSSPER